MTVIRTMAAATAAAAALTLAMAAPAQAVEGRDFASHVVMCQQEMGFSGTHNPGVMHRGVAGWSGHMA